MVGKLRDMLTILKEKTYQKEIGWHETADDRAFRVAFQAGMIRISALSKGGYRLTVSTREGRVIECLSVQEDYEDDDFLMLEELHVLARRSAIQADEILDSLTKDISDGKEIPPPVDDDIPMPF